MTLPLPITVGRKYKVYDKNKANGLYLYNDCYCNGVITITGIEGRRCTYIHENGSPSSTFYLGSKYHTDFVKSYADNPLIFKK